MSVLPNQTNLNDTSSFYSGANNYNKVGVANNSLYSEVGRAIPVGTETPILTVSSNLYPVVGKTYLMTLNGTFDPTYASAITEGGFVGMGLSYQSANGSNIFNKAIQGATVDSNSAIRGIANVSPPLVFTHTDATNVVRVVVTNSISQTTDSNSAIIVTDLSCIELASSANLVTSNLLTVYP